MKKLCSVIISLMLGIVALFGIAGCNSGTQSELQGKIDELQSRIEELEYRIERLEKQLNGESLEGSFYSLYDAYDNGWLTKEDLMSIAYYNNRGRWGNEEIMGKTYKPAPKTPEVLSEETELKIKSTAARDFNKENNTEYTGDDFTITEYYGTYGRCIAVMVKYTHSGCGPIFITVSVAGVNFNIDCLFIQIWREI